MKRQWANAVSVGQAVDDLFVVIDAQRKVGNGARGPWVLHSLTLGDRTGSIAGAIFNAPEEPVKGSIYRVRGQCAEYDGKPQIKVESLAPASAFDYEESDFAKASPRCADQPAWLESLVEQVEDERLRRLAASMLARDGIFSFPAARSMHHVEVGGLLQHTCEVAETALAIARTAAAWGYARAPQVDLVLVGALIHDVAKVLEYGKKGLAWELTRWKLVGHAYLGMRWIEDAAAEAGLDEMTTLALQHIVAAHHGRQEFGAIEEPASIEAAIVHAADMFSATHYDFQRTLTEALPGDVWGRLRAGRGGFAYTEGAGRGGVPALDAPRVGPSQPALFHEVDAPRERTAERPPSPFRRPRQAVAVVADGEPDPFADQ